MMLSTRRYSKTIIVALLIVCVLLQSCVRTEILQSKILPDDTTKDIKVYTFDKRVFYFNGGNYNIVELEGQRYVKGKGKQYGAEIKSSDVDFDGEVAFNEIERIEWREKTTMGKVGDSLLMASLYAAGTVVLIVALYLIFALGYAVAGGGAH